MVVLLTALVTNYLFLFEPCGYEICASHHEGGLEGSASLTFVKSPWKVRLEWRRSVFSFVLMAEHESLPLRQYFTHDLLLLSEGIEDWATLGAGLDPVRGVDLARRLEAVFPKIDGCLRNPRLRDGQLARFDEAAQVRLAHLGI